LIVTPMSKLVTNRSLAPLRTALAAVIAGMAVMAAPHPAAAQQSIFHSLSNLFGGSRDDRFAPPNAYAEPTPNSRRMPDLQAPPAIPQGGGMLQGGVAQGGATTYCVRLCDGRYFPLSSPAASTRSMSTKACAAMCPAAKTAVYRGSTIDGATGNDGERYADLGNAFVYRERLVADCTCNGRDAFGLAHVDIATDPTLRAGDIVATGGRLQVFKGSRGDTHKTAEFTPIDPKASSDMRRALAGARVSRND
jgi:hypothetical protein